MKRNIGASACACALLLTLAETPAAAQSSPPPPAPAADPRALLKAAKAAVGPDAALAAAADFEAEQSGRGYAGEQGRDPADALQTIERRYHWWFDADGGRLRREAQQLFPGGIRFHTVAGFTSAGGWQADVLKWRTGTDLSTEDAKAATASRARFERMFPHLALRQAEAAGETLLSPDGKSLTYRDAAGELIQMSFDPLTGLMTSSSVMRDGTPQSAVAYGEYVRRGGIMTPNTVQLRQGGQLQEDVRLDAIRFAPAADALFTAPSGYAPPPPDGTPGVRALAPGAWVFENMPFAYRSMAVDAGDHFILLEAPLNPAYAERQREVLRSLAPDKPVRYVVVTHHHGDHTGGLKSWVEAGATLLVAKGAAVAIRRQLTARGLTRAANVEEVAERRTLPAVAGPVDLYAFEGSHAAANLLAHLPRAGILFQGDQFYVPDRGEPPAAFPVTADLVREIRRLGLKVETIVGVHGRPGTKADLELSIRRGAATGARSRSR